MSRKALLANQLEVVIYQNLTEELKVKGKLEKCTAIVLNRIDGVGSKQEEHSAAVAGHQDAGELAEMFHSRAEIVSSGSDDRVKFELAFLYNDDKPRRFYPFSFQSALAASEFGAEEATAKGLVKSSMSNMNRGLEMAFQQMNAVNANMVDLLEAQGRLTRGLVERAERAEDEANILLKMMFKAEQDKLNREHEFRMKEIEKQESAEWKRQLIAFAPAAFNMLVKQPGAATATVDTSIVRGLFAALGKMPDDLKMQLLAHMPEEVQAPTMHRGLQLQEEEKMYAEARKKALEDATEVARTPEAGKPNLKAVKS